MFPTFNGTSRRPRNVNLSGQRSDPFGASAWGSAATGGVNKSIAEAQAERLRRQQDRDRLKAAQQIQRVWRGSRDRQAVRDSRRRAFDALYAQHQSLQNNEDALLHALSLFLACFTPSQPDDLKRLIILTRDLYQNERTIFSSQQIPTERLERFVGTALKALTISTGSQEDILLVAVLARIFSLRPLSALGHLDTYYTVLARFCTNESDHLLDSDSKAQLEQAIATPLAGPTTTNPAYRSLVVCFLPTPNLVILEQDPERSANIINQEPLCSAIMEVFAAGSAVRMSKENRLWLLAHLVALQRAEPAVSRNLDCVKVLHILLGDLAERIRPHFTTQSSSRSRFDANHSPERHLLPEFVTTQLSSLTERKEIGGLLEQFTLNYAGSSPATVQASSILAAYILVLFRCFPGRSDDIRMRLYLADFAGPTGKLPTIRLFWDAVLATKVFSQVVSNEKSALTFLLQRNYFQSATSLANFSSWDLEWRTVLLFLELYVFILRLADDKDFFDGVSAVNLGEPKSRIAMCTLPLGDLKKLSLFLKNLGFTLYYNAAELLQADRVVRTTPPSMEDIVRLPLAKKSKPKHETSEAPKFNVVSGIDFNTFRNIVSTALRMLYERDSRRSFLPAGHWLMTSRFQMEGFIEAVVQEEERQHQLGEDSTDDEDEEDEDENIANVNSVPARSWGLQTRSHHAAIEQHKTQHRKLVQEKTRAVLAPKLEILRNMPFVIPFEVRVQIFRQFVQNDKVRRRKGHVNPDMWRQHMLQAAGVNPWGDNINSGVFGRHHGKIRRGHMLQDALKQFYELGTGLKEPIQITFVDKFDTVEAGIDGGGVTKEFITGVTKEAFIEHKHDLFVANKDQALYPNPSSLDCLHETLKRDGLSVTDGEWQQQTQDLLRQYEFLGRIVGKSMYEGILLDVVFAGFFLLKWSAAATETGYRANINDLREIDEELYQGLLRLKSMPDVSELDLDFTVTDQVTLPARPGEKPVTVTLTRNLIPNGNHMAVTNENRPLYISYMARHRLVSQSLPQTQAFVRGLGLIIHPSWLSMFNQTELQCLVGGEQAQLDVEDLRRNTVYSGVFVIGDDGLEHPTIQLFWQAMREFDDKERRLLLKFVTSSPRAPLLGFTQLSPNFSIRDNGSDQSRLPSSATCANMLRLPRYDTLEVMKERLRYAITSGAGFDLS